MFKLGVVGAAVAIAASLAGSVQAAPQDNAFTVTNLVTDSGASAATVDPSLVNGTDVECHRRLSKVVPT